MAIVKIISHGKNAAGTKNVLSYVLDLKKTGPDLCGTLGDISEDAITAKTAFLEFQRIRNLFGKDNNVRTPTVLSVGHQEKLPMKKPLNLPENIYLRYILGTR